MYMLSVHTGTHETWPTFHLSTLSIMTHHKLQVLISFLMIFLKVVKHLICGKKTHFFSTINNPPRLRLIGFNESLALIGYGCWENQSSQTDYTPHAPTT